MAAHRDAIDMAVRAHAVETLAVALGLGDRELVALVGGGGKTSALRLLAAELAAGGARVAVTTTTAMFLRDMAVVGPVVMGADGAVLIDGLRGALAKGRTVAAARSEGADGKVVGLSPGVVDELWAAGPVDSLIVEADGSRGRSLKAFGPHEPQVPAATTTIVLVAGLDAIGEPLDDEHVHRAQTLATLLALPTGGGVTTGVFVDALREQVRRLRHAWKACRIVVLLNKAEAPDEQALGLAVARELLAVAPGSGRRPRANDEELAADEIPDAVVVASLAERRYAVVSPTSAGVSVAAIVLAAGRATRMGEQKLLLSLGGRPLVRWAVDAALGSTASSTVVVVGHEATPVAEALADRPVTVVVNWRYEQGMSTSLQAGLMAAGGSCDAAIFMLGDQPFVTSAVLDRLIKRFAETRKAVVRPLVAGQPANPVLMSAELFAEILAQRGDVGGREIVARHSGEVCLVAVDDPRVSTDIDSVEDYEAAREIATSTEEVPRA